MPYADPARSLYCAVRHLLRQAKDARALRRNPLVLKAVPPGLADEELVNAVQMVVDRAFAAIDASLATAKRRRRTSHSAILLRCDVFHEPRGVVARDLGLSLPQFERVRRDAMTRLVDYFRHERVEEHYAVGATGAGLARTISDRAMRLADSGDRQSALTLLDSITQGASPQEKITALICVSEIEAQDYAVNRSRAALESAAALLRAEHLSDEVASDLRLMHEAASLRLRTFEHGPQAAAQSLRLSEYLPVRAGSVALLVAQGEVLDACGMAKACSAFVSRAAALAADLSEVDPVLKIDLAFLQRQMDFWLNPSAKSRTGLDEAIASARAAGFSGRAVFAELSRRGGQWVATGDPQVRRAYRALHDRIARSVDIPRHTRFFAHWDAADIECAFGDPWRAADAARKALVLAPNLQRALLMKALLARAYARGGRLDISRRIAVEVVEGSSGSHDGMALLSAKRTLAHLASLAARPKEEFTQLTDAADLARRHAPVRLAAELDERLAKLRKRAPSVSIVFQPRAARG